MNRKKEEIIDVEFSVVDDNQVNQQEKHIWVLCGENMVDARLVKVSMKVFVAGCLKVACYISQIEGDDIKDPLDLKVLKVFEKIPTKDEQKQMIKDACLKHGFSGEICLVGERYAGGHLSVLKLQRRIKGGAYVSV